MGCGSTRGVLVTIKICGDDDEETNNEFEEILMK